MARHQRREFGVPTIDINAPYGFQYETAEIPQPEIYNLQRQLEREQAAAAEIAEAQETPVSSTAWSNDTQIGKRATPHFRTLKGYKFVLREKGGKNNIQFAPHSYAIFDGPIVRACGLDKQGNPTHPAFDPDHPYYRDYAPLRRNLAILRNYLLDEMLPSDGKMDSRKVAQLQAMANTLGKALSSKKSNFVVGWLKSSATLLSGGDVGKPDVGAFMEAANIPDQGIATMYNYLLKVKNTPSWADALPFFKTPASWPLAAIEDTAFSQANMDIGSRSIAMEGVADAFDYIVKQLYSVDVLSIENKKISVEEAEKILQRLRITLGNNVREDQLSVFTDAKQAEARMMLPLIMAFKEALDEAGGAPNFRDDPLIAKAIRSFEQISYSIKTEALIALQEEGKMNEAKLLSARMEATPDEFKTALSVSELLDNVEQGLTQAEILRKKYSGKSTTVRARGTPAQIIIPAPPVAASRQAARQAARAAAANIQHHDIVHHDTSQPVGSGLSNKDPIKTQMQQPLPPKPKPRDEKKRQNPIVVPQR